MKTLRERLHDLLHRGRYVAAARELARRNPGEAAEALTALEPEKRHRAVQALEPSVAADVLEAMRDDVAADVVSRMEVKASAAIVREMKSDEEVDLLQEIAPEKAEAILALVDREEARSVRELLAYPEDTAGGLMQSELIAIREHRTAGEVVQDLRARASEYQDYPASYLYVVDDQNHLDGVVSLRALLLCEESTPIASIANPNVVSVPVSMPGPDLVALFRTNRYLGVPVVDDENTLVGIVTQDDVFEFDREEREEELLSMTGIVGGEELREMPLRQRSWRRLSWLSVNILLNMVAASVIAIHQSTVQAVIALAVFLPIISDMSGCSGNQAVAVSIRELTLGRLTPRDYLRVVGKESSVGLINGFALGLLLGLAAWAWKGNPALGLVVGAALWINTIIAVMVGGLVPLFLRGMRQDPALASGPVLTTLTDMCGFFIVLTLANHFLRFLT